MLVRLEFPGGDTAAEDPPNGIGESLYKIRIAKEELMSLFQIMYN